MESVSLNLDLDNNEDDDDIEDRHKEIQGLLSTAFDDLSSLSDEDADEGVLQLHNEFKNFSISSDKDNDNNYATNWSKYTNGLTSTPLVRNNNCYTKTNGNLWTQTNGNKFVVNDIHEEDEDIIDADDEQEVDNRSVECLKENKSSGDYFTNKLNGHLDYQNNSLENPKKSSLFTPNERQFNQRHVQLLIEENQRLSNELLVSQQKQSAMDGNYEGLQFRLKELNQINAEKENQLVKLEAKLKSLEVNVKVERETKEEFQRKVSVCESTIESLQYQLMEIEKSDCLVRRQEIHDSVVNSLKTKHENELILFKREINDMKDKLNTKEMEMIAKNKELEAIKVQNNDEFYDQHFRDMIKATKDLWEQEMKGRVESDIKGILEMHEKNWRKNAEQDMINERNRWEQELQSEILELINCVKIKAKVGVGTIHENIGLRFVSLINLWQALEVSCDTKEKALIIQTQRLSEAKKQLEEALQESRLNHSVVTNTSRPSNENILLELRHELQKVSDEAILMKKKLHKYKLQ
ncbi:myb-like protein D, partial [Oppia nitens]|uniref:myb-like protein D n=1 Tax=Oppia nitens TaxID=1686743 RepID=UPI0023DA9414